MDDITNTFTMTIPIGKARKFIALCDELGVKYNKKGRSCTFNWTNGDSFMFTFTQDERAILDEIAELGIIDDMPYDDDDIMRIITTVKDVRKIQQAIVNVYGDVLDAIDAAAAKKAQTKDKQKATVDETEQLRKELQEQQRLNATLAALKLNAPANGGSSAAPSPKTPKKQTISKILRNRVWNERVGDSADGKCVACKGRVSKDNFECGHIVAEALGGATVVDNLTVMCSMCNKSLGTRNLAEFMAKHGM